MPQLSDRGLALPFSPYRKLTPYADAAKARGVHVLHLNIGQPDIETPPTMLAAVQQAQIRVLEYSPTAGYPSYRHKLAGYYQRIGMPVVADDILVTTGGSEALLFAFMCCFNPGDEVIIPEPFYGPYLGFAEATGVRVVPVPSYLDEGFRLPPIEELAARVTERTRAILICNPNNPTGYVYRRDELAQLLQLCQQHDLYLLSDEAYREFCYDAEFVSPLQLPGAAEHVVVLDTISKRYSACGARIGAFVTKNKALYQAAFKFAQLRVSPPGLGQLFAEAAAELPPSYFDHTRAEYRARRDLVLQRLRAMPGVECPTPSGAFYIMARLPVDSAERFAQWLLEEFSYQGRTTMISPAAGFYATPGAGHNEVRLAYVINQPAINAAMDCLAAGLRAYPGRVPQPTEAEVETSQSA
ncbi:pyridoxal phosphate-dependent aminotransferase [Hymenobacter jeollabukensis]|uniref:Pyridoxal phosphate-dependent aminotransferase n=1 Tax=Hymenobacter jeollabukensis TaxID=2025313 RepID=A0A5R8WRN1_9BACT|nr:pyridoxal phosphate-dependent aminotransferase [Hymenobacter jeollabukensis]TLM93051.1 pyridoxal phosphate-dependent aminotransferase [Hymenobacter jeollabukensis]